jgi:hypothetical protein
MTHLKSSALLYAHVALLRRRVLLKLAVTQFLLGAVGAVLLTVGFILAMTALFLVLRSAMGDLAAVSIVAVAHGIAGGLALSLALREPKSPGLDALADAETAAMNAVSAEAAALLHTVKSVDSKLELVRDALAFGRDSLRTAGPNLPPSVAEGSQTSKGAPDV